MSSATAAVVESMGSDSTITGRAARSGDPLVFTNIYDNQNNIAIWERELSQSLKDEVESFLKARSSFKVAMTVTPESVRSSLLESFNNNDTVELCENIAELVECFVAFSS